MFKRIARQHKSLLFIAFLVFLFLQQSQPAFALEATYPNLGVGTPTITNSSSLAQYAQYFFYFALAVAGIIGVISIVIAGIKILIYSGSPVVVGEARERIFGAVLGIVLLLLSVILLRTINPDIINPLNTPSQLSPGVYLTGNNPGGVDDQHPDGKVYQQLNDDVPNTADIPAQFTDILYYCPIGSNRPNLLIWFYNETDFQIDRQENGHTDVTTFSIPCGAQNNTLNFRMQANPVLSLRKDYEDVGIYYYLKENCAGISSCMKSAGGNSCAQKSSGNIPDFDNNYADQSVKSMRIVSGSGLYERIGVILNKDNNQNGECSQPVINSDPGSQCYNMSTTAGTVGDKPPLAFPGGPFLNPYSAYIIHQNPDPQTSGLGVWLYSSNHKSYWIQPDAIGDWYTYNGNPVTHSLDGIDGNVDNLLDQLGTDQQTTEPNGLCFRGPLAPTADDPNARTCLSQIDLGSGSYNVVLYTQNSPTGNKRCDVYNVGVSFVDGQQPFIAGKKPYRFDIIPSP